MARTKINQKQVAGKAADLLVDFGNGTPIQALLDGKSLASPNGTFKIGNTLIQYASTTISLTATNTDCQWSVNWPQVFSGLNVAFVASVTGWSTNITGGMEGFNTSGASGYFRTTGGTVPRNITVYALAIGN